MVHVILTRWHPHRRLGEQSFLYAHFMSSRYALGTLGSTAYFGFHPSSVFVHYTSSGLGSHIWGHTDWPHTCPPWYAALLVYSSSATFRTRMFPCVWTVIFWHHWRVLAWLFCHIRAQKISLSQHRPLHQLYQCWLTVHWITLLSPNTLSKPSMHFSVRFPAKADTVSHTVNEWNFGSSLGFADPNAWLVSCMTIISVSTVQMSSFWFPC